jgi:ABC-type dipeptide/oligopeptide/nickel transport system ATPase component
VLFRSRNGYTYEQLDITPGEEAGVRRVTLHVTGDYAYGHLKAVDDVSLSVGRGETLGLVGESGCGKTTLGRAILALEKPHAGHVTFHPRDAQPVNLTALPEPARRVRDYPYQLSGGLRQRVLIAIALACRPSLVIADEPTTALDVTIQAQILDLLREMRAAFKLSMLLISHDLGVVAKLCDTVSVIHSGRIMESAGAAQLFTAPIHPYTRALFAATPRYDRPADVLAPIPEALAVQLWDEARALDAAHTN